MAEEAPVTPEAFDTGVVPETSEPAAPAVETPTAPEAPAWSFEFGDKKFADPTEAKRYFDSWNGRLSAQSRTLKEYQEENNRWAKWYEDRKDLIEKAEKAREVPAGKQPEYLDAVDWTWVEQLLKEGNGQKALQYLAYTNDGYLKSRFEALQKQFETTLQSTVGPIQEQRVARELATELFTAAQTAADEQGNAIYPELAEGTATYDEAFVKMLGAMWRQLPAKLGLDPEGYGIDLAYHRARVYMAQIRTPARVAATQTAVTNVVRDATGRFVRQTEAAAGAIGGSNTGEPGNADPNSTSSLKRAIKTAGKYNADLGVWED